MARSCFSRIAAPCALAYAAGTALAAPTLTLLSAGQAPVTITAISGDGSTIAGDVSLLTPQGTVVVSAWWSNVGQLLGQRPTAGGQSFSAALSFDGSKLLVNSGAPALPGIVNTQANTLTPIPGFGPNNPGFANDLSGDGSRAAIFYTATQTSPPFGLRCDVIGGLNSASTLAIPGSRDATNISGDGLTVVGQLADFTDFRYRASDGVRTLCNVAFNGNCPGGSSGPTALIAQGISATGNTIVGGTNSSSFAGDAFRLDATYGFEAIVSCGNGYGSAAAVDVSADGNSVVGNDTCNFFGPWLWRRGIGAVGLRQLLEAGGVDTSNFSFGGVAAISDDGRYITGTLTRFDFGDRGYVIDLGTNTPACDSIDFNQDGLFPDDQDLIDFLSVLAGGPCSTDPAPGCNSIDFNNDGLFPDDTDLIAFLRVLAGGECNG